MRLKSLLEQLRLKFKPKKLIIEKPLRKLRFRKLRWYFLPLWVIANAIGYSGGGVISASVSDYVKGDFGVICSFAVMSMAIALSQWLVIRKYIFGMEWLLATWLGGTVGGTISSWTSWELALRYGETIDFFVMYTCLRGLTTGLAQWKVLRQYFRQADWWIVGTTVSWYISLQVGFFLIDKQGGYFLTIIVGAIYGLLTGMVLLLLFWSRRK